MSAPMNNEHPALPFCERELKEVKRAEILLKQQQDNQRMTNEVKIEKAKQKMEDILTYYKEQIELTEAKFEREKGDIASQQSKGLISAKIKLDMAKQRLQDKMDKYQ
jgi:hypothetical protein